MPRAALPPAASRRQRAVLARRCAVRVDRDRHDRAALLHAADPPRPARARTSPARMHELRILEQRHVAAVASRRGRQRRCGPVPADGRADHGAPPACAAARPAGRRSGPAHLRGRRASVPPARRRHLAGRDPRRAHARGGLQLRRPGRRARHHPLPRRPGMTRRLIALALVLLAGAGCAGSHSGAEPTPTQRLHAAVTAAQKVYDPDSAGGTGYGTTAVLVHRMGAGTYGTPQPWPDDQAFRPGVVYVSTLNSGREAALSTVDPPRGLLFATAGPPYKKASFQLDKPGFL